MVVKIKIIWAKTCPICKKLLKEILLPLQILLPDKLVIEFKETTPLKDWEGTTPLLSGGYYKTAYGKTPEIYMDDKVYVFSMGSYTAMYKFLKELLNKLNLNPYRTDMTVYRKQLILNKINRLLKKLEKKVKEEERLLKMYYGR